MRWRLIAAVMVAGLGLGGCGVPAGTDGDLVDDWPGLPEPTVWIPQSGSCYGVEALGKSDGVIPCSETHLTETIHVGTFVGEAATAPSPPLWYEEPSRAAHQSCDDAARTFLGDHWQAGRVLLTVSIPEKDTWSNGGRWFRCDLREIDDRSTPSDLGVQGVQRRGTLRGGLRGERPMARNCYFAGQPVSCSSRHDLEFAGLFHTTVPAYADKAMTQQKGREGCLDVVARFVDVPRAQYQKYADLVVGPAYNEESGYPIRAFRCLVLTKRPVSHSLKNAGPSGMS